MTLGENDFYYDIKDENDNEDGDTNLYKGDKSDAPLESEPGGVEGGHGAQLMWIMVMMVMWMVMMVVMVRMMMMMWMMI